MAARTKGFARKLAAERLAESLGVNAPAQGADVKAVPLRILPLVAPHRAKGLYAIRIERVPQLARLSRGRNNGNGSWSLTPEEIDGLEYIGPDSAMERPSLALRLLDNDGGTIAMLELPVDASVAEDLGREAVDPDYLRRLNDELQSARSALAEREKELSELRRAPREDGADAQRRLDAAAQMAQEQAKKLWEDDERARFAAAEARWRESADRAASDAQAKAAAAIRDAEARAAAQIADAERGFKDRLAAAEAKARDAGTAAAAGQAVSAEAARLRDQVAGLEATLKRRDEDYALLRRDVASAQQRAKDDLAAAEKQWQARAADETKRLAARAETAERALAGSRDAQGTRDAELRTLQQKLADSDRALATARDGQSGRDAELRALQQKLTDSDRVLAAARDGQNSRDAELRALQQKLTDSDRALAAARDTKGSRDAELGALQQKLADSDRALVAARGAQSANDAELRALRDERTALQAKLAAADAAPKGAPSDAVARQVESALAAARVRWEDEAAARIAPAVEAAVAAARTEWQAGEAERIATAEAKVRAELPSPPEGVAPEAVQQQVDAALTAAKAAWKGDEATRLAQAEEKWRTDSTAALARLTKRAEAAEAALAQAKAAPPPPPMVAAPPPAPIDQGLIDNLHHEIDELRKALSDREVETAQLKMTLEARRLVPEPKPKFYPAQHEPEREMTIHDPRRSNSKLMKEVLFVFGVIVVLFVGFPFAVPYLPYGMQDSIYQMQASIFGTAPAADSSAPAGKPAPAAATIAATGTPAVIARAANVRASASSSADVVSRLKKGDPVIVLGTEGNWTHIKTSNVDGWVFTSYLKK